MHNVITPLTKLPSNTPNSPLISDMLSRLNTKGLVIRGNSNNNLSSHNNINLNVNQLNDVNYIRPEATDDKDAKSNRGNTKRHSILDKLDSNVNKNRNNNEDNKTYFKGKSGDISNINLSPKKPNLSKQLSNQIVFNNSNKFNISKEIYHSPKKIHSSFFDKEGSPKHKNIQKSPKKQNNSNDHNNQSKSLNKSFNSPLKQNINNNNIINTLNHSKSPNKNIKNTPNKSLNSPNKIIIFNNSNSLYKSPNKNINKSPYKNSNKSSNNTIRSPTKSIQHNHNKSMISLKNSNSIHFSPKKVNFSSPKKLILFKNDSIIEKESKKVIEDREVEMAEREKELKRQEMAESLREDERKQRRINETYSSNHNHQETRNNDNEENIDENEVEVRVVEEPNLDLNLTYGFKNKEKKYDVDDIINEYTCKSPYENNLKEVKSTIDNKINKYYTEFKSIDNNEKEKQSSLILDYFGNLNIASSTLNDFSKLVDNDELHIKDIKNIKNRIIKSDTKQLKIVSPDQLIEQRKREKEIKRKKLNLINHNNNNSINKSEIIANQIYNSFNSGSESVRLKDRIIRMKQEKQQLKNGNVYSFNNYDANYNSIYDPNRNNQNSSKQLYYESDDDKIPKSNNISINTKKTINNNTNQLNNTNQHNNTNNRTFNSNNSLKSFKSNNSNNSNQVNKSNSVINKSFDKQNKNLNHSVSSNKNRKLN